MTPTPADLAAALETVRVLSPIIDNDGRLIMSLTESRKVASYDAACELIARWLAENAGRLRVVRPLEWHKECIINNQDRHFMASGAFGTLMTVTEDGKKDKWVYNPDCGDYFGGNNVPCDSLEDGKARCEAIYADRLAAALAPAFPAKEGEK